MDRESESFALREGWHSLHAALDQDFFYLNQHQVFGREAMFAWRLESYKKHVRDLTRIERRMDELGLKYTQVRRNS
jgi:hypothetical protein